MFKYLAWRRQVKKEVAEMTEPRTVVQIKNEKSLRESTRNSQDALELGLLILYRILTRQRPRKRRKD